MSSLGTVSSSEGSVSESLATDTSEFDLAATLVTSHRTLRAQANVQQFFTHFIDLRLGVREVAGGNAESSSRDYLQEAQYNIYEASTTTDRRSASRTKRSRQTEDGNEDSGQTPNDNPGAKRPKPETTEKLKIACPFMKWSPEQFSTWRTCVGPGFDGMNRMKEHLKRRHFKEHTCERCGDLFESKKMLQEHQRLPISCILKDAPVEDGFMNSTQWDEISRKRSRCSVEERWKEIYLILFPDTAPAAIPSPYFDMSDVTNNVAAIFEPEEYEAYLKCHLPPRVLMRLQKELAVLSETIKAQLAVIVQEESSETLKAYVRQKNEDKTELLSESINIPPELPVLDGEFLRSIKMFGDEEDLDFEFLNADGGFNVGMRKGEQPADSGYGSLG
ncbi:hypothetical protein CGCSCA4_v006321 [Colletotrichum siamense]|uniref:C2H2-type domain-containing protein n=1 Tax=Colletotrichum siamense TaxID=690259 RepID=A0A9P5EKL2_COLSI|nr:hypothetical protein CGCSCA4_v006321 [Colletotrichum siamense]KAF4852193.1 hypothetical protein CGCSCA2_v010562 [Colletotrichum siamense]